MSVYSQMSLTHQTFLISNFTLVIAYKPNLFLSLSLSFRSHLFDTHKLDLDTSQVEILINGGRTGFISLVWKETTADMEPSKPKSENIEHAITTKEMETQIEKGSTPVMRTKEDDLGIWQSVRRYKWVSTLAMIAAFSASLDGYRKYQLVFELAHYNPLNVNRNQSKWWHRRQQGFHSSDGQPWDKDHQQQICLCMGRDPGRWPNHRANCTPSTELQI